MLIFKQCVDKREWDEYVLENGGHPLQLWGWGDQKVAHGWKADRLFLNDEEHNVIGAVQVLIRKLPWPLNSLAYVPRGPVIDQKDRAEALTELVVYVKRVHHSVTITIEPDSEEFAVPQEWIKSENHILPSKTIILDLTKSEPELQRVMEPNTRRYIRRSSEEGLVIKQATNRQGLDDCLTVYKETAARAGFNLHNDQYYYDVSAKLGDHSMLFVAYKDELPVAFLWLAISAETAFELYGGMTEIGRKLHASYALKWHAISKCKTWGLSRYDFGGLIDGGVTAFKKGWDNKETNLAGTFDYPLSPFYGIWNSGLPMAKKVIRKIKSLL